MNDKPVDERCFECVTTSLRLVGSDMIVKRLRRCKRRAVVWDTTGGRGHCAQHFAKRERRFLLFLQRIGSATNV